MKIVFFKSRYGTFLDHLISLWTFGKYSHCEIVDDKGMSYSISGTEGGVYKRRFIQNLEWDVIDLNFLKKYAIFERNNEEFLYEFFNKTQGSKYDWLGLFFKFTLNKEIPNRKYYCSEWCCEVIRYTYPWFGYFMNTHLSPNGLYRQLKKLIENNPGLVK